MRKSNSVIKNESSIQVLVYPSENNYFYTASCSSFEVVTQKSLVFEVTFKRKSNFVNAYESSLPGLVKSSEKNYFYNASCSSTHVLKK